MFGRRRSFDSKRLVVDSTSIRARILFTLGECNKPMTAWQIAREINALGSSVSSLMFKMRKAGLIKEVGVPGPRGGRTYTL